MQLATEDDVAARLGRDLTSDEEDQLPGLLDESSALVEGYLGVTYTADDTVPSVVALVVSRLVARALTSGAPDDGSTSEAAGVYSIGYKEGAARLWLGRAEKLMLRKIGGGIVVVGLKSERC